MLYKDGLGEAEPQNMTIKGLDVVEAEKLFSKCAYGDKKSLYLSSWYMNNIFGEKKLLPIGIYISLIIIIGFSAYAIGGIL